MISEKERVLIFRLIEQLTGATPTPDSRQDSLINNVERRILELGFSGVVEYLKFVDTSPPEFAHLVSSLTIHTTSWFRENPHFVVFQEILLEAMKKEEVFKVWCAACSTGEEVYSFALLLEEFRRVHPNFEYRVVGTDIDVISIAAAERAVYPKRQMNFHVSRYKNHILEGSGKTHDFFTLSKEIRNRCSFKKLDLRNAEPLKEGPFHVVICRNVLIYFSPETVSRVIQNLLVNVRSEGYMMLGHSEAIQASDFNLVQRGHSVYMKHSHESERHSRNRSRYRILTVDGSASMRDFYEKVFSEMGFESVVVASGTEATSYLNFNDVDLITLESKLPDMSGEKWLQRERAEGLHTPAIVISDLQGADAKNVVDVLAMGAQEYIEKEQARIHPRKLKDTFLELIRAHAEGPPQVARVWGARPEQAPEVVMIGASTGGPQALVKVLADMPSNCPPIVITQHMSPKFTRPLAERLCEVSGLKLGEVENGAPILPGHLYLAQGDYHLGIGEEKGRLVIQISTAPAFNGHRPSVDFMFNSVLGLKPPMMAILLTGMGRDGALGLRFLRKEGVFCIAQSEEDCVVYGMPKEAIEREAADYVGTIDQIRLLMFESFRLKKLKTA